MNQMTGGEQPEPGRTILRSSKIALLSPQRYIFKEARQNGHLGLGPGCTRNTRSVLQLSDPLVFGSSANEAQISSLLVRNCFLGSAEKWASLPGDVSFVPVFAVHPA